MTSSSAVAPARAPRLSASRGFRRSVRAFTVLPGLLVAVFLFLPAAASSQPMLTFKRVTVNWPTIELYISVGCDGKEVYSMTKQNFRILENGVDIPEFTLWCPEPSYRCAASISLVADASASLKGSGLVGMQAGLTAFTQLMDGVYDEAALITAGNPPVVRQLMTLQTPLLRESIDSLRASGGSAVWGGAMLGLQHLIDVGVNQCRAVILFTDGMDNLSTTTVAELISLANRHRIRIFTIGFGNVINTTELELLALLTGGRYYQTPNAGQFAAIYQEITATMIGGWYECIITYERDCAEGSMRTVEMQLKDFCGGDDAKTKTYRAPLDSTTFTLQRMRIGEVTSGPRDEITVPLLLDYIPGDAKLRPFDITISSASPSRPLIDVSAPSTSPLSGALLHIDRYVDSVRIRLDEEVPISATGTLLELRYHAAGVRDSSWFPLGARVQEINIRCAGTIVDSGGYRIVPRLLPRISPEGDVLLCPRGTVELKANEGFVSYRWSTGETTRAIIADTEGPYFVDVVDGSGDTLRSESVFVRFRPDRHVWLEPQGPLTICRESSITFRVAGDTAGTRIFWKYSNRDQRTYQIKASEGVWAKVVDEYGCVFFTDTMWTTAYDPPVTLNVPGNVVYICPGDSVELRVEEDYPFYFWDAGYLKGDSVRSIFAHADGGHRGDGRYSVYVRDRNGCRSSWHSVTVREYPSRELTFTPAQRLVLCPGEETFFSVAQDFAAYRWSTGDTSRTIIVRGAAADGTDTLWLEGISSEGCVTRTAPLVVETVSQPKPRITPGALTALCPDDRVLLDAGEGYAAYRWSTGDSTRFLEVGEEGSYTVEVMTHGGCLGLSDTLLLKTEAADFVPVTYAGLPVLCPGDTLLLEAPAGYAFYRWNTGAKTRTLAVHSAGMYAVAVLTPGGCEGTSEMVYVSMRMQERPEIRQSGLTLSTDTRVQSIQWFRDGQPISGATTPIYTVSETGRYAVQVVDSCGAVLMSDEIDITTLGTEFRPEAFRLDVYPDPSEGMIHVELRGARGPVHAELLDLLGRRITRREWTAYGDLREQLDFRSAPPGIYLLRLAHPDGLITRRLTKSK